MKKVFSVLVIGCSLGFSLGFASVSGAAEASQQIQCQDAAPVSAQAFGNLIQFQLSGSKQGKVAWINEQNNTVVESATLEFSGESKKHEGYSVYTGAADDGSGKVLFELPSDLVGKSGSQKFTGYFYDLEQDGGPDVPLGFTLNCTL